MVSVGQGPRLDHHPSHLIDPSAPLVFEFNGRAVQAYEGDTIASALYASGTRIFSRSLKYHRARGLLCVSGRCPNCMMNVDGVPNVRACTELVRPGMSVRHQNAWPSLDHDMLSVLDRFDRLMPVGFYYKTFHRPKVFWKTVSPIIRRVAGLGALNVDSPSGTSYRHEYLHADVAVVGGGPAGMSAALTAAHGGARVVLIDDQTSLGGHLRFDASTHSDLPEYSGSTGFEVSDALTASVRSARSIEVISPATAFGLYEGNLLGVLCRDRMVRLRARSVVIATGSQEAPLTFDRNDLPGVMLSSGIQRLIHLYGAKPGSTAMVATSNDQGYQAALDLLNAGVRVAVLADSRPEFPHTLDAAAELQSHGVLTLTSHAPTYAEGVKRVLGGVVARLADGVPTTEERQFDCDVIATSGGYQPASALLQQAGCEMAYDASLDETVPRRLPPNVFAAGEVTGIHDLRVSVLQGRLAGMEAATNSVGAPAGSLVDEADTKRELSEARGTYVSKGHHAPPPAEAGRGSKKFVCFCEDVTSRDITFAVDEGFEDIQTLKRYSTVTMGPCQGKMCLKTYVAISARRTGQSVDQIGLTTARPPFQPVPLAALAGPSHIPIKRSPLDRVHREMGARITDRGAWQRPYSYTTPQEECLAVRNRVGIIDVSTLGKIDVIGRDAPALLDKVYTHRFSDIQIGRIRYAVMCADDGTILDDGTVTRLAEDHYFITTSTSNVDMMEQWIKWWAAGTGTCVHVTNLTSAFASINVAGPRARETLAKLTDVDLSTRRFRYMRSQQSDVAGVPTVFLRIGFVGETGWELHFPTEYGEHVWEALLEAGKEYGIEPFGVEAQVILRLEKKHVIVGQDTDGVSNPIDSDMEWVVRFDKPDFIGRAGLVAASQRPPRDKLVGFVMRDGHVPHDGAPVVSGYAPVGRVTSSRLSPTLGRGCGLAWVPSELAQEGKQINIWVEGRIVPADVTLKPVYDPEGKRLRP